MQINNRTILCKSFYCILIVYTSNTESEFVENNKCQDIKKLMCIFFMMFEKKEYYFIGKTHLNHANIVNLVHYWKTLMDTNIKR